MNVSLTPSLSQRAMEMRSALRATFTVTASADQTAAHPRPSATPAARHRRCDPHPIPVVAPRSADDEKAVPVGRWLFGTEAISQEI